MDESSSIMNDGTPVSEWMVSPEHRLIANRSLGGGYADARFPSIHDSDIKKQKENIDGSEEEEE